MSFKEAIIAAGTALASEGSGGTCQVEPADLNKYWRAIDDANNELASLGVSVKWDDEEQVAVLTSGSVPTPAPAPEPAPEPVVEVDVEKEEEFKPKRWGI